MTSERVSTTTGDWRTEEETAVQLGVALVTLRNWRRVGKGPAHHRFGRLVRYSPDDIERWIKSEWVFMGPFTVDDDGGELRAYRPGDETAYRIPIEVQNEYFGMAAN